MKIAAKVLLVLVILGLLPVFFADRLARKYAVEIIEQQTGFRVDVGDVDVGVYRSRVQVKNLILTNPPEFPHPEALAIREIYIHYDWLSLFQEQVRVKKIRIDVSRVVMVKSRHEKSNLEVLAKIGEQRADEKDGTPKPKSPPPTNKPQTTGPSDKRVEEKPERSFKIDELNVKLGELEIRQYRELGNQPSVINVQVNMDRTLYGVTNMQAAVRQLSSDVIMKSGAGLFNPAVKDVADKSGDVIDKLKVQLDEIKDKYLKKRKD